ncbi:TRAP transporter small permease [Brenneria tiliae]|uniref:TRAP transporter small permease protein n=1 Tax=Brenneria tiliae TaxID=2914984 RepID=A0ABT0N0I3_9GAMM|nr:TRAP transporter small permease subunit [Brenneria tiliae]MCL2895601.1 TRAP transporter small permease subunit [Brenneria tiliae]MCL2900109.1 TRAP transporter small permease subunit [Brenneria tiliae]MCL2904404.1 TRAP transporter small permease subunit [Brenneria tiliae]
MKSNVIARSDAGGVMINRISSLFIVIAAIGIASLAILMGWAICMRWFWGSTPQWAEELPEIVLVWATMLGMAYCSQRRSHLNAGLLGLWLRNRNRQHAVHQLMQVVLVVFMLLLAKAGWDLTVLTMEQKTTALQWPVGVVYGSVPLSCLAVVLINLGQLFRTRGRHE